jgi:4-hydroxy-tetrahydrodipicolinate synthase
MIVSIIYPLARVFYADPFVDMHNRMKEALVLLGKLPRAVVWRPLVKISHPEISRIREALVEAGMLAKERESRAARLGRVLTSEKMSAIGVSLRPM